MRSRDAPDVLVSPLFHYPRLSYSAVVIIIGSDGTFLLHRICLIGLQRHLAQRVVLVWLFLVSSDILALLDSISLRPLEAHVTHLVSPARPRWVSYSRPSRPDHQLEHIAEKAYPDHAGGISTRSDGVCRHHAQHVEGRDFLRPRHDPRKTLRRDGAEGYCVPPGSPDRRRPDQVPPGLLRLRGGGPLRGRGQGLRAADRRGGGADRRGPGRASPADDAQH